MLHFENERFTLTTNFDMETKLDNTTKPQHDAKLPVIGCVYGQTISGTLFKHKVIMYQGKLSKSHFYLVENIETGFRHVLTQFDLHSL